MLKALIAGLMGLVLLIPVNALAGVVVTRIKVMDREARVTDAATLVLEDGADQGVVRLGQEIPAGASLKLIYPKVQIQLTAPHGVYVMECEACTPEQPALFTPGGRDRAFKQVRGVVIYDVKPGAKAWFKGVLEVISGPDVKQIPVGVKGTIFRLSGLGAYGLMLTVLEGIVEIGGKGAALLKEVGPGKTMVYLFSPLPKSLCLSLHLALPNCPSGPGSWEVENPASLKVHSLEALSSPALIDTAPFSPPTSSLTVPVILISVGVAVLGTGGVLNYLANDRNHKLHGQAQDRFDANACSMGRFEAAADAKEFYNQAYNDSVALKKTTSWVLLGMGGATAAAGVTWLLVSKYIGVAGESLAIQPTWTDQGWSLGMDWRF
jgi:hypothetical protein